MAELVLRPDVGGSVALELEIREDGTHVDDPVEVGVKVVPESWRRDLLGRATAADHVTRLEYEHLLSCLREIAGAGEPVVTTADEDDVVAVRHSVSLSSRGYEL